MKNDRQKKIIELVENRCIETQEQLLDQLRQCGFHSTQATVSRDIKELQIVKIPRRHGRLSLLPAAPRGAARGLARASA